ncbi:MAG: helix-turn-helix domain-containing protein [Paracoccus sp. (in: a-proteobacteria)]|uniref:helix-turn-helix domain-containing protein n=1 Tax=Paracoccus sp. TaxID=267 RepID=UPI00391C9040
MQRRLPDSVYQEIRQLQIFAAMEEAHLDRLMRGAYLQNFPPQTEMITEGERSDFLHIVLSGSVDLFSIWNGRETSLETVRPISTFILAATITDGPYLMSARTLEKSRIALIPSGDVRTTFVESSDFARAIVVELSCRYRSVIRAQKDLKLRTSLERLANYLLRQQKRCGGGPGFNMEFEKRRLASILGMAPENLSRGFKSLQPYGVLVEGMRVTISDQAALENFAKPNPYIDLASGLLEDK